MSTWTCNCTMANYITHQRCKGCGKRFHPIFINDTKPDIKELERLKTPLFERKTGDWFCHNPNCGAINYRYRKNCLICNTYKTERSKIVILPGESYCPNCSWRGTQYDIFCVKCNTNCVYS